MQQRQVQQPAGQGLATAEVRVEILQIVVKLMAPSTTFCKIVINAWLKSCIIMFEMKNC